MATVQTKNKTAAAKTAAKKTETKAAPAKTEATKTEATEAKADSGEALKQAVAPEGKNTPETNSPQDSKESQETPLTRTDPKGPNEDPTQETPPGSTPPKVEDLPMGADVEGMIQTMPPELETLKTRPVPPSPPIEQILETDQSSDGESLTPEAIKAKAQRQVENLQKKSEELALQKADVVVTEDSLEVVTERRR